MKHHRVYGTTRPTPLHYSTHWDECHEVHHPCALEKLEKAWKEVEAQQEIIAEAGSVIGLGRSWLEAMPNRTLAQDELLEAMCDWEDKLDQVGENEADGR